jgi:tRNA(Arg) A34 adenosine deaminase TadA
VRLTNSKGHPTVKGLAPVIDRSRDREFMREAMALAEQGAALGEVPVGAVLVLEGQVVGRGFNQPITAHDPSAHAEMVAIREAAAAAGNYRLPGSTLYVTLEPCSMCAGLLVSRGEFFAQDFLNHKVLVEGGVLAEECSAMLSAFFKARRKG